MFQSIIMNDIKTRIAKLYKTDSSRLLAVLTRIFGSHNFELAEDTLQDAFSKALIHWQQKGIPDNPSSWIIRTAKNQAIDTIRANKTKIKFADDLTQMLESEWSLGNTVDQEFKESNIKDDQLRMIFMCCHEDIKPKNRIPFILKTLCGFSIQAIAKALLLPEATVKKRLLRTKEKLKNHKFEFPMTDKLIEAMGTVHIVLYLLFNEGFYSSDAKQSINIMFCQEAIGLVNLLIAEPKIANQDTLALFALMHFNIARIDSKVDNDGFIIPIDLQDRKLWKKEYINTANQILNLADLAPLEASGRFFYEALIAKEHCQAIAFEQTDWDLIVEHYEKLIQITDSPIARLNQAIAIGYAGDTSAAIKLTESLDGHKALKYSHMPLAILAHLNAKVGDKKRAYQLASESKKRGGTPHEHRLMMHQIERLLNEKTHIMS
jgi:RNA polymerase sigma factor (sigma-70 family)